MNVENEVKELLLDYLKRITKETATPAEVAVVPAIAKILLDIS